MGTTGNNSWTTKSKLCEVISDHASTIKRLEKEKENLMHIIDEWKLILLNVHCKNTSCLKCNMDERCYELGRPTFENEDD